jgi:Na+/melibiose symporter-like transporter
VAPAAAASGGGSLRTALLYGAPALALSAPVFLFQFYFLNFATDVLRMAPATVGVLVAAGRVWDAVSDPLVGSWSDRTRTRLGRRRPWLLLSAPAVGASCILLWTPPAGLAGRALEGWTALALLVFFSCYTAWAIPHKCLAAELSPDPHARSRLFGVGFMASLVGVALAFGGMQTVANASDPRGAAAALALAAAPLLALILLVPPLALREHPLGASGSKRPFRALLGVLADRTARRLLAVTFLNRVGQGAQGSVGPFMAIYVLGRPDMIGVFPVFYIAPLVLSVPLWLHLARRLGRRRLWRASLLLAAAAHAPLFWLREGEVGVAALLLACAGASAGCTGPLAPSLLSDAIDADARASGERKEGSYFAAFELVEKAAAALVVLLVGVALELSGFAPGAEQGRAADLALRLLLAALPCATFAAAAAALGRPLRAAGGA